MYAKPNLSLGGACFVIHACAHSIPFLSTHIGSGPGEGVSGKHVQPFVPCFSTFIDGMSMMVAPLAMAIGAADMALLILSASVAAGFAAAFCTVFAGAA